jgi:hypothetical protein
MTIFENLSCNYKIILLYMIIITFLLYFNNKNKHIENYDSKIINMSKKDCANKCKITERCRAFVYSDTNNTCYLSKNFISSKPHNILIPKKINAAYISDYDDTHTRCNKLSFVDNTDSPTFYGDMRNNSVFKCSNINSKKENIYYQNDNKFEQKPNYTSIFNYGAIDNYKIIKYDWSDKLLKKKENFPKKKSFNDKINDKITSFENKLDINNIKNKNNTILPTYDNFYKYTKFNKGDYLYDHKCSFNTSEKKCLDDCINAIDCVGVEWNSKYNRFNVYTNENENFNGVCCHKKNIGPFHKRIGKYKNGTFYIKKKYKKI